jgi:hypothetical protein
VLAPFFADAIFHRGSQGLGLMSGAMGVGAVTGTLVLARRTQTKGLPEIVLGSSLTLGAGLIAFAASPVFGLTLAMAAVAGFSIMRQNASANTLIQSLVPEAYRGRIMALYSMTVIGVLPLGSLAAGALAERFGARMTVAAGGAGCLGMSVFFRRFLPLIRKAMAH